MAALWLAAGIGSLLAYFARFEVPSGSPTTLYATFSTLFFGLSLGTFAGRWWPPRSRVLSVVEQFPRASVAVFWILFAAFGLWMLRGSAASAPWCAGAWFGYMVGVGGGSRQGHLQQRRGVTSAAGFVIGSVMLVTMPVFGDSLLRTVSLDITDTVDDYRRARVEDAVRLQMRLCRNGECLTRQDWACGFNNGDQEAFDRCFDDLVAGAAPSVRLDAARKYCGNLTMKFAGTTYSTPEKCQSAGGNWGIKSPAPTLGF